MADIAREDISEIITKLKDSLGKPINPSRTFSLATFNSLWHIVTGERLALDDLRLETILDSLNLYAIT